MRLRNPGLCLAACALAAGLGAAAGPAPALAAVTCATRFDISSNHRGTYKKVREEHRDTQRSMQSAVDRQTAHIDGRLDAVAQRLVETLALQAGENSAHLDKQIEAHRRIRDAAEINATDRLRQRVRSEAESGAFDPNPFSCLLRDMSDARRTSAPPRRVGSGVARRVTARISGADPAVQAGGVRLSRSVVEARDRFAGLEEFSHSANPTADWSLLLDAPTLKAGGRMPQVADWIVANAIDPTPPRPPTPDDMATPQGVDRAAQAQKTLSRQRAAAETIAMALNLREPVLRDAEETFAKIAEDSGYRHEVPATLSELQQIDILVTQHFAPGPKRLGGDPGMHNGLDDMNAKGWLQELHRVMSVNARINYLRLELASRAAIVDALILATLNAE